MPDNDRLRKIKKKKEEWECSTLNEGLKRSPESKKDFNNLSWQAIKRLYTPIDSDIDYINDLGFPGEHPFTRGIYPTMYRGRLWTMREFAGFGTADETNKRFKYLLKRDKQD